MLLAEAAKQHWNEGGGMKILHIMAGRRNGGAETYCADVIAALHEAGLTQCVVMQAKAPRLAGLKAAGVAVEPGVLGVPLPTLQRYRIGRLMAREKPDIVHCWMRRAASLVPATSVPVIGWFGGYYDVAQFARCTHFVGVTRDIVAHMVKSGVPASRATFIPTFPDIVPAEPADRAALATPPDAKVLLTLSRLHEKKGLDTLLEALAGLPGCVAWLAGDGPLQADLERLADKLGVRDRVRFLGWRTDRSGLLRAADVCVLPSRYEPFGTVILEAWAAGTPLVACASAGPAGAVTDGVDGLLSPIDDAAALRANLGRVSADADLARRLVAAGAATYRKSYTREAVTGQWLAYYRNLSGAPAAM